ncbi:MAG: creatininase family protein [Candidatus Hodarchaeales archaeon]|jgi:creatinine amidohydrolase
MISVNIEHLTWIEAEKIFKQFEVVLIAIGARTKEHGPHLPLNNDFLLAEYLKERVMEKVPVIVFPTLQYGFYPAFLEYSGSVSISFKTFKNLIIEICQSISNYGISRFYILNTGISTLKPLKKAADELLRSDIILEYLNLLELDKNLSKDLIQQNGGSHADEGETSLMLYIAPEVVDMTKAVKDFDDRPNRIGLTRDPQGTESYSPTGIWGDPTLATREKGRMIAEILVDEVVNQIKQLRLKE